MIWFHKQGNLLQNVVNLWTYHINIIHNVQTLLIVFIILKSVRNNQRAMIQTVRQKFYDYFARVKIDTNFVFIRLNVPNEEEKVLWNCEKSSIKQGCSGIHCYQLLFFISFFFLRSSDKNEKGLRIKRGSQIIE